MSTLKVLYLVQYPVLPFQLCVVPEASPTHQWFLVLPASSERFKIALVEPAATSVLVEHGLQFLGQTRKKNALVRNRKKNLHLKHCIKYFKTDFLNF